MKNKNNKIICHIICSSCGNEVTFLDDIEFIDGNPVCKPCSKKAPNKQRLAENEREQQKWNHEYK